MAEIVFSNPLYLWFLLSLPILVFTHSITFKRTTQNALKFANFEAISRVTGAQFIRKNVFLLVFRLVILSLIILAAAGTKFSYVGRTLDTNYVLAVDNSASMFVQDIEPNRIAAAKETLSLFLDFVPRDTSLGLISFSGITLVENPMTNDFDKLSASISSITGSPVDGTDIGNAIVTGTNMLLSILDEKSKVIILLTDGQSNIGLPLEEAIQYANENNVLVNTIGIGTKEGGEFFGIDLKSTLDEESLIEIADRTGGKYFRSESRETLTESIREISRLYRKKISIDLSFSFVLLVLLLLLAEWILINTKNKIIM